MAWKKLLHVNLSDFLTFENVDFVGGCTIKVTPLLLSVLLQPRFWFKGGVIYPHTPLSKPLRTPMVRYITRAQINTPMNVEIMKIWCNIQVMIDPLTLHLLREKGMIF